MLDGIAADINVLRDEREAARVALFVFDKGRHQGPASGVGAGERRIGHGGGD